MASFDNSPLRWDDKFISETTFAGHKKFGTVIGHGLMTYSFMVRAMMDWPWPDSGNHRRMETRFRQPVYPGDTVRVQVTVRDKRETRKGNGSIAGAPFSNRTMRLLRRAMRWQNY